MKSPAKLPLMTLPGPLFAIARALMRTYWRLTRPLTAGARVMVIDDADQVLLVRHTYMPGWFLPGGGVERGETMRQAAERELREEVGVLASEPLSFFGLYANFKEFKSDHVALYVLRAYEVQPRPNREIAEFGFFGADALPDGVTAATRSRIEEVMHGRVPPDYWSPPD